MSTHRTTLTGQHTTTVVACESLSATAYVLKLDRQGLVFQPGQCVILGVADGRDQREYSIYSSLASPTLDVLIREVEGGKVSRQLRRCKAGEMVTIEGPVGFFTLDDMAPARDAFLFIATGTGIAPFHSMVASLPGLRYRVLHGVRTADEAFGRKTFDAAQYVLCTSRDAGGDFAGRVTDCLQAHPAVPGTQCLLCGNVKMIDEVYDVLARQGVSSDTIRAEVYF
ncbi:MAG: FAD-binding oxidoreductase [Verrucomicrobia bacterium]|nr:FAD-binding oxidoreductase [Verrucomicrobiota bacterium]